MWRTLTSGVAAAAALGLAATPAARAAEWTPTRDITFMIPYAPGGGFDTITRKLSPYVEKYLGGKVHVVPKNVQGARGTKAAIELTRSRPDGTKIMIFNMPGHAVDNIKGDTKNYDMTKFTWLARIAKGEYVMVVSGASPYKTFQDLLDLKRPVKNPELGPGGTSFMTSTILWKTFGKEVQFITGYKGSSEYALAVVRGDGDITMLASGSFRRYIGGGDKKRKIGPRDLRPVLELTDNSKFGVKTAKDYGHPELDALGLDRVLATVPGTPGNIASVLDAALRKAINDPEFAAWADKVGQGPVAYLNGAATAKSVKSQIEIYKKYADAL